MHGFRVIDAFTPVSSFVLVCAVYLTRLHLNILLTQWVDCSQVAVNTDSAFENELDFDAVLVKVTFEHAFLQQRLLKDAFTRKIFKHGQVNAIVFSIISSS